MARSHLSEFFFILLDLLAVSVHCANPFNITGEAVTTRFWDCCKPSCGWKGKADFSRPVLTCKADGSPTDIDAGTGCNGGNGWLCSEQQPWAINDTLSYGFAGAFLTGHPDTESFWCCACYQLDFTSEPLRGKTMIVQASNTAYDVTTANRFSLAVPGGNTTNADGCTKQYNVDQTVFGEQGQGVSSSDDCGKLPEQLQDACRWRFDWFKDASFSSANFKRVVCPKELTDRTQCIRNDEKVLAGELSLAPVLLPTSSKLVAGLALIITSLL